MKEIISLNEKDLKKILAEHYKVNEKDVHVNIYKESKGYGMNEHDEPFVIVNVITEV